MNSDTGLYDIGDMLLEYVNGRLITTGIITEKEYSEKNQMMVYGISWEHDHECFPVYEYVLKWKIDCSIWEYLGVLQNEQK